jgi:hypothetical protein
MTYSTIYSRVFLKGLVIRPVGIGLATMGFALLAVTCLSADKKAPNSKRAAAAAEPQGNLPHMISAMDAIRRGDHAPAKRELDIAIRNIEGVFGLSDSGRKARSYSVEESRKFFLGESHERVLVFLLRGFLYLDDNDLDNARACFKSASFHDLDLKATPPVSDVFLAEYMDVHLASVAALTPPQSFADNIPTGFPASSLQNNLHLLIETGHAPAKRAFGSHRHILGYEARYQWFQGLEIRCNAAPVTVAPPEDFYYHATSRGSRDMDRILARKAQIKDATSVAGDAALVSASALLVSGSDDLGAVLVVGGVGLVLKGISALGKTAVDTRYWTNQPRFLWYASCVGQPGTNRLELRFQDKFGDTVRTIQTNLVLQPSTTPGRQAFFFLSAKDYEY